MGLPVLNALLAILVRLASLAMLGILIPAVLFAQMATIKMLLFVHLAQR